LTYTKKKYGIHISEIWYNAQEDFENKSDVIIYKYVHKKKDKMSSFEDLFTIMVDLAPDEKDLFSRLSKTTKYQINRAREKDKVLCFTFLEKEEKNEEKIKKYIEYFNEFARSKKRPELTFAKLEKYYNNGALCIRCAADQDQSIIYTMHAYIVSDNTARLHQSASHFRNSGEADLKSLIARANRRLHWDDILYFKSTGLKNYDFGGWYGGKTDAEKLSINQFKESFGGTIKQEYSYIVPGTLIGRLAIFCGGLLGRR
jgi:lipid II:glycine glycyltransferase (peptidoglycan interpeptide bridge formation enzyme)